MLFYICNLHPIACLLVTKVSKLNTQTERKVGTTSKKTKQKVQTALDRPMFASITWIMELINGTSINGINLLKKRREMKSTIRSGEKNEGKSEAVKNINTLPIHFTTRTHISLHILSYLIR